MRRLVAALVVLLTGMAMSIIVTAEPAWASPACPPTVVLDDVTAGSSVSDQLVCDDPSGSGLNFVVSTDPAPGQATVDGTGYVTYYAPADYHGPDGFEVSVSDNAGGSVTVSFSVDVVGAARPVCQPLTLPDARPAGSVSAAAPCTDADGDELTYRIVSLPAHGSASVAGSLVRYGAASTLSGGPETFTFAASDGLQESEPQTASVHVLADGAPACVSLTMTSNGGAVDVPLGCLDPEGDSLVLSVVEGPPASAGTLGAVNQVGKSVRFTPATGFAGNALVRYGATDQLGAQSASATVTIAVSPAMPPAVPPAVPSSPAGESAACTKARTKLAASRQHLRQLKRADAPQQQIARAQKKVKKAKKQVAAACG